MPQPGLGAASSQPPAATPPCASTRASSSAVRTSDPASSAEHQPDAGEGDASAQDDATASNSERAATAGDGAIAAPGAPIGEGAAAASAGAAAAPDGFNPSNVDVDEEEGLLDADCSSSVVMRYFELVRDRLLVQLSSRTDGLMQPWLRKHLQDNEYWLRAHHAKTILQRLGATLEGLDPDYIRDLRVWLPYIECGHTPPCPSCECSGHVGVHDFRISRGGYVARRVRNFYEDYYIMTCRYI